MKTIFKYPIEVTAYQTVSMRASAKILSAQIQHGVLCLWAECDPANAAHTRAIEVFGTGQSLDDKERRYIATVLDGQFAWHVYERT